WIVWLAKGGLNEGPVALYALLAIFALWLASHDANQPYAARFMLLSGFLAGSAVACKYPPLLFIVVPLGLWVGYATAGDGKAPAEPSSRNGLRLGGSLALPRWTQRLFHATIFLAAAFAACGLWFAKNW